MTTNVTPFVGADGNPPIVLHNPPTIQQGAGNNSNWEVGSAQGDPLKPAM